MEDLMKKFKKAVDPLNEQLEVEKRLQVFPFQVGDNVELCGMCFKVEKIHQNPVNRVMLKGIPRP